MLASVHRASASLATALLLLSAARAAAAQHAAVDSLLRSPGASWEAPAQSEHFRLHVEAGSKAAGRQRALLDSLEEAWAHAHALLKADDRGAGERIPVVVTGSRTRFPALLSERSKGVAVFGRDGVAQLIVLVHNDSVRAYARHEVMHAVARHRWGPPAAPTRWIAEGLAAFADGRCLGSSVHAVARGLLAREAGLTVRGFIAEFGQREAADRARAYALAGSLVGYIWDAHGREAVREVWRRGPAALDRVTGLSDAELTRGWRDFTLRATLGQPAPDSAALTRRGCG